MGGNHDRGPGRILGAWRFAVYILFFFITFGVYWLYDLKFSAGKSSLWFGIVCFAVLIAALCIFELLRRYITRRHGETVSGEAEPIFKNVSLSLIQEMNMPIVICDEQSRVIWLNKSFRSMYHMPEVIPGRFLDQFTSVGMENLLSKDWNEKSRAHLTKNRRSAYDDAYFHIQVYPAHAKKKKYYISVWSDCSEQVRLEREAEEKEDVVAQIIIDNLDDMMQVAPEKYRIAAVHAAGILEKFGESVHGILREYESDKFLLIFKAKYLDGILAGKFAVMDEIREIHVDDNNPITLSIGIAKVPGTLEEKEAAARLALDTAIQRGGDQAVYKTPDNTEFYGGRTKIMHKRTKVRARVMANELTALIAKAENVLIMGHRFPDHDAIGSCVGLARLCMFCGVDVKIATDMRSENIAGCLEKLKDDEDYKNVFADATHIAEYILPGTLLIVSDVCNVGNFESPELYENIRDCVIIDHHRRSGELPYPPIMAYIEPSASSASEMVAEMLEQALPLGTVSKTEADLLLAGILLDTDQFTRNTGVRTFSAAMYLRDEGAEPSNAKLLFRSSLEDFERETKFRSNVRIYKERFAIAWSGEPGMGAQDCIAAAKAADKLLMVRNVSASFALVQVGDVVHISGRSGGEINVQLILETLGGGGHFDAAAARLSDSTMKGALDNLITALDGYLANK